MWFQCIARADGHPHGPSRARLSRMWDQADASLVPRGLVKPASTVSVANFSALLTATLSKTALLLITKANPVIKAEKLDKIRRTEFGQSMIIVTTQKSLYPCVAPRGGGCLGWGGGMTGVLGS
ncbi:hypothetical protein Tco_0016688 [Tanacetum coccineum]